MIIKYEVHLIENLFKKEGVRVVWQNEAIKEGKACP
jgi:hypothetical protein